MPLSLQTGVPAVLDEVIEAVARMQMEGSPVQLHPGDLGWASRFGVDALASSLRVWRRGPEIVAVGMVDTNDGLIRMAISPMVDDDAGVAERLVADLSDPARGVLPSGRAQVEARAGAAIRRLLQHSNWVPDEAWTPLRRNLSRDVEDCGMEVAMLDVEHIDDRLVRDRVTVGRASFENSTFTIDRWHAMAASPTYRRGRCLIAYDSQGAAVAATTVWSAGVGKPGLIEPLGVHRDHRGLGFGRAITIAAAATLRDMGSSSVTVCTPSANVRAVAAYASAGFEELPAVTDFRRP